MKSLRELYRIGKGPSSSHTMGPQKAAKIFWRRTLQPSSLRLLYTAVWQPQAKAT